MSRRLTLEELAREAGTETVADVLELGALAPGEDGRFDPRDAAVVATVTALLQAGFAPDDLRWLMAERTMRFDVIGRLYSDPGPPSTRTVADLEQSLGPDAPPLAGLYRALGLPAPGPDRHLATSEESLVQDYLAGWLAVDPSGAAAARVARAVRDAVAHVTETWLDTWDAAARPSISTQGGPADPGIAVGPDADGTENPTIRMADVGRRLLPMLLDRSLQAALNTRIVEAVETHVAPVGGRLVKVLGDGVLLLFPDPASAVAATVAIVAGCEGTDLLPAHGAIAAGRVVRREGDVYGATVNLAARLLASAGPGEVLVEEAVVVALPRGTARLTPVGRVPVRGFPDPIAIWRAEAPAQPS